MKLKYLTITGADDKVSYNDLQDFIQQYPFIEWAILFSEAMTGQPRYPTKNWRFGLYDFCKLYNLQMNRAAHLCGQYMKLFAEQEQVLLEELILNYQRVQLNFNAGKMNQKRLEDTVRAAEILSQNGLSVITQYNTSNIEVPSLFAHIPNHVVLFDSSGGNGIAQQILPPLDSVTCGYAGGIGPENVASTLLELNTILPDSYMTWIDMETRVRDEQNQLVFEKIKSVAEQAKQYL